MKSTKKRAFAYCLAGALAGTALVAQASDHQDWPDADREPGQIGEPVSDIVDFYTFTSPAGLGKLVLVMNLHPAAGEATRFSDRVDHVFRLRRVDVQQSSIAVGDEELAISCRFSPDIDQVMTCSTNGDFPKTVTVDFNDESGGVDGAEKPAKILKGYAGLRREPFFLDVASAKATLMPPGPERDAFRQQVGVDPDALLGMPTANPTNFLTPFNVLSIVVEVDLEAVFGKGSPVVAAAAETRKLTGERQ